MDKQQLDSGGWLTDNHISAAQTLLKDQFPHIDGLQPPTLSETEEWSVLLSEGVQILNDPSKKHWICVSTVGCPTNVINLYDSLKSSRASPNTVCQIANFFHCQNSSFTIQGISSKTQSGTADCGLFAIATATSLCFEQPPASILWDQSEMCKHLGKCFEKKKLEPFPGWPLERFKEEDIITQQVIPVYCNCWMPEDKKRKMAQCVQCKDWYHQTCSVFKKKEKFLSFICS